MGRRPPAPIGRPGYTAPAPSARFRRGARAGAAGGAGGFEPRSGPVPPPPGPAMDFSELFKLSGLLGRFSPDGKCLVSRGRRLRGIGGNRGRAPGGSAA